jgi:hypothetical protein
VDPVTYQNPVLVWLPETSLPPGRLSSDPPPVPFTVTRSEIIIRQDEAPLVHIWYAAIPAEPR